MRAERKITGTAVEYFKAENHKPKELTYYYGHEENINTSCNHEWAYPVTLDTDIYKLRSTKANKIKVM